jgi:hypothetical protein
LNASNHGFISPEKRCPTPVLDGSALDVPR